MKCVNYKYAAEN